jgi:hypothetical protein
MCIRAVSTPKTVDTRPFGFKTIVSGLEETAFEAKGFPVEQNRLVNALF